MIQFLDFFAEMGSGETGDYVDRVNQTKDFHILVSELGFVGFGEFICSVE